MVDNLVENVKPPALDQAPKAGDAVGDAKEGEPAK